MTTQTIHPGDALAILRTLPANSVHCIVTSPPYYGLRDYGVPGQIGMEETIAAYVAKMVEVFEECRRVLRDDGTLWLNLGDSYAGSGGAGEWSRRKTGKQEYAGPRNNNVNRTAACGLKPKNLIGIPWRIAFALQEAGWWLRADIIWAKKAPMPESVTDRPTRSHEHIFLFAKSSRYFYDADAVREDAAPQSIARIQQPNFDNQTGGPKDYGHNGVNGSRSMRKALENFAANPGRNQRDVWELGPEPYPDAHFAVFPTEIPRRAILAGTSEKGCCPACGSPWKRTTARQFSPQSDVRDAAKLAKSSRKGLDGSNGWGETPRGTVSSTTTGWQPTCACGMPDGWQTDDLETIATPTGQRAGDDPSLQTGRAGMNRPRGADEGQRLMTRGEQRRYAQQLLQSSQRDAMAAEAGPAFAHYLRTDRIGARPIPPDLLDRWLRLGWLQQVTVPAWEPLPPIPCTVLDPFLGSGTTLAVAASLGRAGIGIELNPDYIELSRQRIERQQLPLPLA